MGETKHLLSGIRVVEAANMVYVPCVGAVMADFGAEVIKVEPPGGGDIHRYGHQLPGMPVSEIPYAFQMDNRNKKSVVLDLRTEPGKEAMLKLLRRADVFLTNYRRGALKRLNMTYDDLRPLNPRLIYAYGSGYGEIGPEADKPGYDSVCYWSRSGIESTVFPLNDWLGPLPYGSGDHPSGMMLMNAVLLALLAREKTGLGTKVSNSLIGCGVYANSVTIQAQLCNAQFNPKVPRENSYNFTYIYYLPKDKRVFKLNIQDHEKLWVPFCQAIGRPELAIDPRFATIPVRVQHMSELIKIIDEVIAQQDAGYWFQQFVEYDIPHTALPTYEEIANDPQLAATGVFVDVDHPRFGKFRTVDSPMKVEGYEKVKPGPSPELGEHTREVLAAIGYSEKQIREMLDKGAATQK
jgi:crotonobetainyl-CoA:carnitine CoA-transferase CaiB-like acyl-CoA transferase